MGLGSNPFGGHLQCETCGRREQVGSVSERLFRTGWPMCCGYTMRWWTARELQERDPKSPHVVPGDGEEE